MDVLERGAPRIRGARCSRTAFARRSVVTRGVRLPASEEFDMTRQKHLKQLVRARMEKTGERYATARRHVVRDASPPGAETVRSELHFTGNVPAATALRTLLGAAGIRAPHSNAPFSEAMLFGIAGGIGIGVFSFLYEKQNFASFYVAARHDWADDVRYLTDGAVALGADVFVAEGAKNASQLIARALGDRHPVIVWVDAASLPYKAMPAFYSGMASHLIVLHSVDDASGIARVADLSDELIELPLDILTAARTRVKKDKQRVLALRATRQPPSLDALVRRGLEECRDGLLGAKAVGNARTNFSLEALRVWGNRLSGSRDKDSWERIFTPGARLWRGLTSITEYVEHYGTGGGLSRPLFAEFLEEAADALGWTPLRPLAARYAELGRQWTDLADAALPDDVPAMREAKDLLARRSELLHSDGAGATAAVRATWQRLDELAKAADENFPLSVDAARDLRADLQRRVLALHAAEVEAHEELSAVLGNRE